MEEKMIEGQDTKKKSNWLPFLVVVIAAVVLIFASGGDKTAEEDTSQGGAEGVTSEDGTTEGDAMMEGEGEKMIASEAVAGMDRVTIAEGFESWAPDGQVPAKYRVEKSLVVEGDVERALVSATVSVGDRALNENESFYFNLGAQGGHLFRPDSLIASDSETETTLLFDLSELPYLVSQPYDESRTPETADLMPLLEEGFRARSYVFISTLEQGTIEDLSVYYACADGSDCSISVE